MVLFLSQRLDALADQLIQELDAQCMDPIKTQTILVPNGAVKQWLLLEIAGKKGIAMGLKVVEIGRLFPPPQSSLETFCLIYSALEKSQEPEVISYLSGKKKRLFELTGQLSALFAKYGPYADLLGSEKTWQHALFREIYAPPNVAISEPVIAFGIDFLPPSYWQALFKAPSLSVYLFSPCVEFWEDLCSDRERKNLNRFWEKRGSIKKRRDELDTYLREAPRNLANWGKLGRGALSLFDDSEEIYAPIEPTTLLKQIQYDLLTFQETKDPKIDNSIRVLLTGSSRLREIEALKAEILRLNIPYHEISVLAPNIEPYVPLIEYVFGNDIPYRISGFDVSLQSSFRQGLIRLLALGSARWDAEEVLALFETPSFYRKKGWDSETLAMFRDWISSVKVQWGLDEAHRKAVLEKTFGEKDFADAGSWEKGLGDLLDAVVYLRPMHINCDLLEELVFALHSLKDLDLKGDKSLREWANTIENAAEMFLFADAEDEADMAVLNRFRNLLLDMKKFPNENAFPLEVVTHFLTRPCISQIHASKLHALRFAPIDEGAQLPAKALFLIGMDEMSFPTIETPSSLDLLKGKTPKRADFDRYLFLQSIFSATEFLRISYGHLSADEGKPVGASLLVQELLNATGPEILQIYPVPINKPPKKNLHLPDFTTTDLPEGEMILPIQELRQLARHPWRFFLQKTHKIYLNEDVEETFALQRGKLVRALFENETASDGDLPGRFKKAMESEALEKIAERKALLAGWQIEPFSLHFRQNCTQPLWEGPNCIMPPLELSLGKLKVHLVGEIKQASLKGIVSTNEDNIAGTLKIWPEALVCALALNASEIWMLKSGKLKPLQNAEEALKAFINYYFHALKAPSPLLPDWADPILRKGVVDFAKKMDRGSQFEDPVLDWVFARAEVPSAEEIFATWGPFLKKSFQDLTGLYPTRAAYAKV